MFHGVLALLTRSLRQDARQLRNHVFRLSFVAFIYLSLLYHSLGAGMVGAPGLYFFRSIAWLNALFITCAGIGFFASAISEEKEEETIGLLLMAGLNPLGILLGKSTSRLIQAALLLIVQFPFMLLAVTLGGVTPHQILAAYVSLLAYMALLANLALVWSTVCERGGSAAGMTAVCLALYGVLPIIANSLTAELTRRGISSTTGAGWAAFQILRWCSTSCVYQRLQAIMETGFNKPVFATQVLSNLSGAVLCFGAAWLTFTRFNNQPSSAGADRGVALSSTGRSRGPRRTWAMPLVWKDFQFIAGGVRLTTVKFAAYALLFVVLVYVSPWWIGIQSSDTIPTYITCLSWAVVIEASILAARIFHDEVRLQTLSSLVMLPRTIAYLAYSKTLGCLLGLIPALTCLCLGSLLLPGLNVNFVLQVLIAPLTWGIMLLVVVFLHLVAFLSLFVKWGALPLAVMTMAPMMTCCPVVQLVVTMTSRQGPPDLLRTLSATAVTWVLLGLVCFVFQMMIIARLEEIGAK